MTYAKSGLLFNIAESGTAASVDIILCLNGKGPLSCQKYHVSAEDLHIRSTAVHQYPAAGIKVLTPGYTATGCTPYPNGYCLFSTNNTTSTTIHLNSSTPSQAIINASPTSLNLTTVSPGNTGIITITNNASSLINANNIAADLSGTGGALNASYSNCSSVAPGGTCTITFTASGVMSSTSIAIKGSNTNVVSVSVSVDQATISATPTVFNLAQGGASQIVTITNNGPVDAYEVGISTAPGLGINVSGSCASPMAPNDTCQLTFTSGTSLGNTSATIAGSNTNVIMEDITVIPATATTLSITALTSPAVIAVSPPVAGVQLEITNTGSTTAYNVTYSLPSGWNGVNASGSCGDIAPAPGPGNTCTLTFNASQPNVTNTIAFAADNVTPAVQSPAIAFSYQGYLVYSVTPTSTTTGTSYVVDTADSSTNILWDASGCTLVTCPATGATSNTDGQYLNALGNTSIIINSIGAQDPPTNAAGYCYLNTISSGMTVPSGTWYLPATDELDAVYNNLYVPGFGGFTTDSLWTSTEFDAGRALYKYFANGVTYPDWKGFAFVRVRCVQAIDY